jgi:Flp pilus assembly protein TadD
LIDATANLGVIEAQRGNYDAAIQLLKSVFERSPGRSAVGMNLAQVQCTSGNINEARSTVSRVLEFNPDLSQAKKLMASLKESVPKCVTD